MNLDELKQRLVLLLEGKGEIVHILKELDQWVRESGNELDPHLRHYLVNRSYGKALAWIEGQQTS